MAGIKQAQLSRKISNSQEACPPVLASCLECAIRTSRLRSGSHSSPNLPAKRTKGTLVMSLRGEKPGTSMYRNHRNFLPGCVVPPPPRLLFGLAPLIRRCPPGGSGFSEIQNVPPRHFNLPPEYQFPERSPRGGTYFCRVFELTFCGIESTANKSITHKTARRG